MSTSLEEMFEIEPHIRVARARAGVLLLILADALSIVAILAAGGYLSALNVLGQFKASGESAPAFVPGLLLVIVLVLSGLSYYLWDRSARKNGGVGQQAFFILALVLVIVALPGAIWISMTLGYGAPFHAYESLILLVTWTTTIHILLTVIVGLLLLGRVLRGRLVGHEFIVEVVGYWWYFIVIVGLLLWLFTLLLA